MDEIKEELRRYSLMVTPTEDDRQRSSYIPQTAKSVNYQVVDKSKVVRFMNTYRLESKRPFNVESVQAVLKEVLTRDLAEAHYEANTMTKLGINIAGEIRSKIKQLNFDRYKIVCVVQIVEKNQQSILSTARFLWDVERDRYVAFSINNAHIAAMACVFGIYYE